MSAKTPIHILTVVLLLFGPACGFYVYSSLEERARVEAIPPQELPGQVVVYSTAFG